MDVQKTLSLITIFLLRLGILIFLIPFFMEFWENPGSTDEFWMWFLKILYLVFYIFIAVLVLFLRRLKFYNFGFSLVFIASTYKILDTAFKYGITLEQPLYVLLLFVSFYFLTKTERKRKRKAF